MELASIKHIKKQKHKKVKPEKPLKQIDLNLKESLFNRVFNIKRKILRVEDRMRFSFFFRSFWVWLSIFTGGTATIVAFIYIFSKWNNLPLEVPAFQLFNVSGNKLISKASLVLIAFAPGFITSTGLGILYVIFREYERLKYLIYQLILLTSILSLYGLYTLIKLY
jgi:hypothetical protein